MKKMLLAGIAAVCLLAACTEPFKKTKEGLEYKIVRKSGGQAITTGNFMALQMVEMYNDSILSSTIDDGMPQIILYDTMQFPPELKQIFAKVYKGDSIVIKISTDTIAKNGQLPAFMKKGQYVYSTYKIVDVYTTQEESEKARETGMIKAQAIQEQKQKEQGTKDEKTIKDYLAKNNIQAVRAPQGTYVQIISQGTGAAIDTSSLVNVNYTGTTLKGKMFDSNTDPSKGHVEPILVNLTSDPSFGGIIPGWKDGLSVLKVGAKAKFFIPSNLAYGKQGSGADIGPNEILVFDIDVLELVDKVKARAQMSAAQAKMQEMQKRYMDSLQQASQAPPGQ